MINSQPIPVLTETHQVTRAITLTPHGRRHITTSPCRTRRPHPSTSSAAARRPRRRRRAARAGLRRRGPGEVRLRRRLLAPPLRPAAPAHHPHAVRAARACRCRAPSAAGSSARRRGALPGEVRGVPPLEIATGRRGRPASSGRGHRLGAARHRRPAADRRAPSSSPPASTTRPHLPDWPGRDAYTGELLHAGDYRNPAPYAGKDVLVVGVGNTGAEIAVDLVEGGAARVRLAVRTAPHIVRRSTAGLARPAHRRSSCRRLPVRLVDRLAADHRPDIACPTWPRRAAPPGHRACTRGSRRARSPCRTWG